MRILGMVELKRKEVTVCQEEFPGFWLCDLWMVPPSAGMGAEG